jgi:predicted amidohydrolase
MLPVALIQHNIVWEDPSANFKALQLHIANAAAGGARLVVLSEMFSYGFSMHASTLAETESGPTLSFLRELASRHQVAIAGSLPLLHEGHPTNTLAFVEPDGNVHKYRKRHPFTFAQEDQHYRAGDAIVTLHFASIRFTLFICYDLRFADDFWGCAPATDVYLVVANWPETRAEHWRTLLRARAIENQAYVLGVNRVGSGGGLNYSGDSALIDPLGRTLVSASTEEAILHGHISHERVAEVRNALPFLRDRR